MTLQAPALLATHADPGLSLFATGALRTPATLTRAQANTRATATTDGTNWAEFLADTPRPHGAARRLLIEAGRTNRIRNARAEGAVAPSTLPTNWTLAAGAPGVTASVVGAVTLNGLPGLEMSFTGTATAAGTFSLTFESATAIAAATGQSWAGTLFWALTSGTDASSARTLRIIERNATGSPLTNFDTPIPAPAATPARIGGLATLANASAARITHTVQLTFPSGAVVAQNVAFLAPQLEIGPFATTPILPPPGAPTSTTRGNDVVSAATAALGIAASGACTILWAGMLPQAAPAGASQNIVEISDGTLNNRVFAMNPAGGSLVRLQRMTAGAAASSDLSGMTPGTPFRLGLTLDGSGRAAMSLNGAVPTVVTGAPASGFTTLRLGDNASASAPMSGETATLRVLPFATLDATLAAMVAALPG